MDDRVDLGLSKAADFLAAMRDVPRNKWRRGGRDQLVRVIILRGFGKRPSIELRIVVHCEGHTMTTDFRLSGTAVSIMPPKC